MVFQRFNLFPHLTALENLAVAPIKVLRCPATEARRDALAHGGMIDSAGKYGL
jgi:ABC-type polar amino acid transport system ATPase subunit